MNINKVVQDIKSLSQFEDVVPYIKHIMEYINNSIGNIKNIPYNILELTYTTIFKQGKDNNILLDSFYQYTVTLESYLKHQLDDFKIKINVDFDVILMKKIMTNF